MSCHRHFLGLFFLGQLVLQLGCTGNSIAGRKAGAMLQSAKDSFIQSCLNRGINGAAAFLGSSAATDKEKILEYLRPHCECFFNADFAETNEWIESRRSLDRKELETAVEAINLAIEKNHVTPEIYESCKREELRKKLKVAGKEPKICAKESRDDCLLQAQDSIRSNNYKLAKWFAQKGCEFGDQRACALVVSIYNRGKNRPEDFQMTELEMDGDGGSKASFILNKARQKSDK